MTSALWFRSFDTVRDVNGKAYVGAVASFFVGSTTTPLVVYQDNALSAPWGSSVTAGADGIFPGVFLPEGEYNFRITTATGVQVTAGGPIEAVPTVTVSSGGGVVDPTTIFQTGDLIFSNSTDFRLGWIKENGTYIGNALSGSSGPVQRANADCAALYAWYWNNFPDSICPVDLGRSGSAASDFALGKRIRILDLRGRAAVGLDDMGTTAANRIQVSTTINTTAFSASATVASATGLAVGMYIAAAGVPSGTTITVISGTNITMSVPATALGTGVAARFSWFVDAQLPGRTGGVASVSLTTDGLPAHTHTGTTNSAGAHTHTAGFQSGGSADAGFAGAIATGTTTTSSNGNHTHTFTTAASGGGLVHSNMIPAILGTWYRKL